MNYVINQKTFKNAHSLQQRRPIKRLRTERTFVFSAPRRLPQVHAQMLAQIVEPRERLAAHLARQLLLDAPTVAPSVFEMPVQVVLARKVFATILARKRFALVVRCHVQRENLLVRTRRVADFARPPRRRRVQRVQMAFEVHVRRETFRTEVARNKTVLCVVWRIIK